jgi:hypothetical protein
LSTSSSTGSGCNNEGSSGAKTVYAETRSLPRGVLKTKVQGSLNPAPSEADLSGITVDALPYIPNTGGCPVSIWATVNKGSQSLFSGWLALSYGAPSNNQCAYQQSFYGHVTARDTIRVYVMSYELYLAGVGRYSSPDGKKQTLVLDSSSSNAGTLLRVIGG